MNKIKFITEITSTHNGDLKVINFLIKKHLKSSSNFIKFQIFKADQLIDKSHSNFKKFKKYKLNIKTGRKFYKNIITKPK